MILFIALLFISLLQAGHPETSEHETREQEQRQEERERDQQRHDEEQKRQEQEGQQRRAQQVNQPADEPFTPTDKPHTPEKQTITFSDWLSDWNKLTSIGGIFGRNQGTVYKDSPSRAFLNVLNAIKKLPIDDLKKDMSAGTKKLEDIIDTTNTLKATSTYKDNQGFIDKLLNNYIVDLVQNAQLKGDPATQIQTLKTTYDQFKNRTQIDSAIASRTGDILDSAQTIQNLTDIAKKMSGLPEDSLPEKLQRAAIDIINKTTFTVSSLLSSSIASNFAVDIQQPIKNVLATKLVDIYKNSPDQKGTDIAKKVFSQIEKWTSEDPDTQNALLQQVADTIATRLTSDERKSLLADLQKEAAGKPSAKVDALKNSFGIADVGRKQELQTTATNLIDQAQEKTGDDLIALEDQINSTLNDIKDLAGSAKTLASLSPAALQEMAQTMDSLTAWSAVITIVKAAEQPGNAKNAYQTISNNINLVIKNLNYRPIELPELRKDMMQQQQNALDKIHTTLQDQKMEIGDKEYSVIDLGDMLQQYVQFGQTLDSDIVKGLVDAGLINQDLLPTESGYYLAELAKEHGDIGNRIQQLANFKETKIITEGRENPLAAELKLGQLIPDDQLRALRDYFNTSRSDIAYLLSDIEQINNQNVATKADADAQKKNRDAKEKELAQKKQTVPSMLNDMMLILNKIRPQWAAAGIMPYFEAAVSYEQKINNPKLTEKQKADLQKQREVTKNITDILALRSPDALLTVTQPTFLQETKTLLSTLGTIMSENMNVWWQKLRMKSKENTAWLLDKGAIPLSVATFFGVKAGIEKGGVLLGGSVGSIIAPGVGSVAGGYLGKEMAGAISTAAGIGSSLLSYMFIEAAAEKIKPTEEQMKEYNTLLVQAGGDPKIFQKDPTLWQKSWDYVQSIFRSDFGTAYKAAAGKSVTVLAQIGWFNDARTSFIQELGLKPDATLIDIKVALQQKKQQLESGWGINRKLVGDRLENKYAQLEKMGTQVAKSLLDYNSAIVNALQKAEAQIANEQQNYIAKAKSLASGVVASVKANLFGQLDNIKLTTDQFKQMLAATQDSYKSEVTRLQALSDTLQQNKDALAKPSLFGNSTVLDNFTNLLNGHIELVANNNLIMANNLLKGWGVPALPVTNVAK